MQTEVADSNNSELRDEVRRVVQSTSKLRKAGELEELASYRATNLDMLKCQGNSQCSQQILPRDGV